MLYTDEQLREMVDKRLPPGPGARTKALALLREVCAAYEAELAKLRAENADHLDTIEKFADQVGAANEELIRLRGELEKAQSLEPDWSKAPRWAQWWAMDADGFCYWYSQEPDAKQFGGAWGNGGCTELECYRALPRWRTTLRRRPQEPAQ